MPVFPWIISSYPGLGARAITGSSLTPGANRTPKAALPTCWDTVLRGFLPEMTPAWSRDQRSHGGKLLKQEVWNREDSRHGAGDKTQAVASPSLAGLYEVWCDQCPQNGHF